MGALTKERLFMPPRTGDLVLGARMKARRLALGLELEEVANAMSPSPMPRTIRSYESGANSPASIEALRQIANVLQTTTGQKHKGTSNDRRR